jgi:glycine cleavage system transcriptional repressor
VTGCDRFRGRWYIAGMPQLIATALGPDKPGIVGKLTGHLHSAGGNILDSRMVNLRGQFALMILLEAPEDAISTLANGLPQVAEKLGLKLSITEQPPPASAVQGLPYRLKTYAMDQPGIVARLTQLLSEHGVNIEELTARQESAPHAGMPLFLTEMQLTVPPAVSVRNLRTDLETLCNSLNCDVDLEPGEG